MERKFMPKENKNVIPSVPSILLDFWHTGFFMLPQTLASISKKISDQGVHPESATLRMALSRASYLTKLRKGTSLEYIQKGNPINPHLKKAEDTLFSVKLIKDLGKDFEVELKDLRINFRKSGTCSAFLLRKILEKLIFLSFARNSLLSKLEDRTMKGRYIGLDAMINVATLEKVKGSPFLMSKTAKSIQGIKFLGDVSAHDPLSNVEMEDVIMQIPFIVTAYKELVTKLH